MRLEIDSVAGRIVAVTRSTEVLVESPGNKLSRVPHVFLEDCPSAELQEGGDVVRPLSDETINEGVAPETQFPECDQLNEAARESLELVVVEAERGETREEG